MAADYAIDWVWCGYAAPYRGAATGQAALRWRVHITLYSLFSFSMMQWVWRAEVFEFGFTLLLQIGWWWGSRAAAWVLGVLTTYWICAMLKSGRWLLMNTAPRLIRSEAALLFSEGAMGHRRMTFPAITAGMLRLYRPSRPRLKPAWFRQARLRDTASFAKCLIFPARDLMKLWYSIARLRSSFCSFRCAQYMIVAHRRCIKRWRLMRVRWCISFFATAQCLKYMMI